MMQDGLYYRPIPQDQGGRWPLAGGWTGFTHLECLQRGAVPRIVDSAPDRVMAALTAPRPSVLPASLQTSLPASLSTPLAPAAVTSALSRSTP